MIIYSGFSHDKWWFSLIFHNYVSLPEGQRVTLHYISWETTNISWNCILRQLPWWDYGWKLEPWIRASDLWKIHENCPLNGHGPWANIARRETYSCHFLQCNAVLPTAKNTLNGGWLVLYHPSRSNLVMRVVLRFYTTDGHLRVPFNKPPIKSCEGWEWETVPHRPERVSTPMNERADWAIEQFIPFPGKTWFLDLVDQWKAIFTVASVAPKISNS
jgi:hypothetical protein